MFYHKLSITMRKFVLLSKAKKEVLLFTTQSSWEFYNQCIEKQITVKNDEWYFYL